MIGWIVGVVALMAAVTGLYVWSSKGGQRMQDEIITGSGENFRRLCAFVMFATLLDYARSNPVNMEEGTGFDTDRIYPTVLLVGRKIHGDFDPQMAREEYTNAAKARPDFMAGVREHVFFRLASAKAAEPAKDTLILGALTVLQTNIDDPAAELLPLRTLAGELYGGQVEADRRLLGTDNNGLLAESIELHNQIAEELRSSPAA